MLRSSHSENSPKNVPALAYPRLMSDHPTDGPNDDNDDGPGHGLGGEWSRQEIDDFYGMWDDLHEKLHEDAKKDLPDVTEPKRTPDTPQERTPDTPQERTPDTPQD